MTVHPTRIPVRTLNTAGITKVRSIYRGDRGGSLEGEIGAVLADAVDNLVSRMIRHIQLLDPARGH